MYICSKVALISRGRPKFRESPLIEILLNDSIRRPKCLSHGVY